jgi:NitT/TauT family transport system ATP-binding protein
VEAIKQKQDRGVEKDFILDILDEHFSESESERQFETLVHWGRYAQLFEYESNEERLYPSEHEREEINDPRI